MAFQQDTSGQGYSPDPSSRGQKGLGSRLVSRSQTPCESLATQDYSLGGKPVKWLGGVTDKFISCLFSSGLWSKGELQTSKGETGQFQWPPSIQQATGGVHASKCASVT